MRLNVSGFFKVTDLTLARENQTSFEEYLNNNSNANPGIDLTVTVLTTGFWPSYKSFDLNLPAEMVRAWYIFLLYFCVFCLMFWYIFIYPCQVKCVEVFKEFYQTKTKHRKLTWIYSLGTCNIIGKFDAKPMDIIVTTYQVIYIYLMIVSSTQRPILLKKIHLLLLVRRLLCFCSICQIDWVMQKSCHS